ncbi:unnamed protein product [Euphydryas editha]|uniref:Endonuclease/exonuclease/phosphatase domain-containing protein n=1 Tax=Euphydryas editha TaxID=104508 RepID=A0AAU9UDR5_EUPED|nr:unnamed protein product [Euphydryas editha]
MRRPGEGIEERNDYIMFHKGEHTGQKGVGFLIKSKLKKNIMGFVGVSDRIAVAHLKFQGYKKNWTIFQIYAPTEQAGKSDIEYFYESVSEAIKPHYNNNIIIMGDFNAQVSFDRFEEMFNKTVVIVLIALIGIPFIRAFPNELMKNEHRQIVQNIRCSDLIEDNIECENTQYWSVENPCYIKASNVPIPSNLILSSQETFKMSADVVNLYNNVFYGQEQKHWIRGNVINLYDNEYKGKLQVYDVSGGVVNDYRNHV